MSESDADSFDTPPQRPPTQPVDRILDAAVRQLLEIRRGARTNGDVGEELRRALPTLQRRRDRGRARDPGDRRRYADVRVRFTALDGPGYTSTNHIKHEDLLAKGLGRPYTTATQCDRVPVAWSLDDIRDFVIQRFPVLEDRPFNIMRGSAGSKLSPIEGLCGEVLRQTSSSTNNTVRLWVVPDEAIIHYPVGTTPTVQASGRIHARLTTTPAIATTAATSTTPTATTTETDTTATTTTATTTTTTTSTTAPTETATTATTTTATTTPSTTDPTMAPTTEAQNTTFDDSLHLELEASFDDDDNITLGIAALRDQLTTPPAVIVTKRDDIVETVFRTYETLDVNRSILVSFESELGQDQGGLTRDMLTLFTDKVFERYFVGTDVVTPRPPLIHRRHAPSVFKVLGKVLQHFVVHFGNFPQRLATSVILCLCNPDAEVPDCVLLKDFLSFQSVAQGTLLRRSLSDTTWTESQKLRLMRFYSVSQLQAMPSPGRLRDDILCVARADIIDQALVFINYIRSGFTVEFRDLLSGLSVDSVNRLRSRVEATPDKVAQLIDSSFLGDDSIDLRPEEEVVVNFLSDFVRELSSEQLRLFLVWATGSSLMPVRLLISFNGSFGLGRCPVAHTCGPNLELPTAYDDYRDFRKEFLIIINNEECMTFSTL